MEKKYKRTEELNKWSRVLRGCDRLHEYSVNKELQGKNKPITEISSSIKAFKIMNFVHFPLFLEHIQEFSKSIFLLQEELNEQFQDVRINELEFMLVAFPLKVNTEMTEHLKMELANLWCDTAWTKWFMKTLQDCYSYLLEERFPLLGYFVLRMVITFGSMYVCEEFFPL